MNHFDNDDFIKELIEYHEHIEAITKKEDKDPFVILEREYQDCLNDIEMMLRKNAENIKKMKTSEKTDNWENNDNVLYNAERFKVNHGFRIAS